MRHIATDRPVRRSGFAFTTAIILLGLIGTVVLAMSTALAADAKRTSSQREKAQLRQLLIAGAEAARERLAGGTIEPSAVALQLPRELAEDGATLTLSNDASAVPTVRVTIHASLGRHLGTQEVVFRNESGIWKVVSATLDPGM